MSGLGRDFCHWHVSTPFLDRDSNFRQLTKYAVWIRIWFIDFVERNHKWQLGGTNNVSRFFRLRLDAIISSNYQHSHISHLGTTRTHDGERFVTWGIDEGDLTIVFLNLIRTDVLGNPTRLPFHHIRFANRVKRTSFSVVNVTHNDNDWRTSNQALGRLLQTLFNNIFFFQRIFPLFLFCTLLNRLESKFFRDNRRCCEINALVLRGENTRFHELLDDFCYR